MFTPRAQNLKLAIPLMLLASCLIAASTLLAKTVGTDRFGPPLHALQISHGRFLFAFVIIATAAAARRPKIIAINLKWHIIRTACGWCGITLMFAAVAFIPMADATAISFLNPVFAMMLAIPLLGERVGPIRWGAAALALFGALILLRPTYGSFQPAALLALMAAGVMGLEIIFIKKLSNREGPFQILLINNAIGLCIATMAVIPVWHMPTFSQWIALAGVGTCMAAAQTCFVNSIARAEASLIVPFSYATLVFAALFDAATFGQIPDYISFIGASVILSGAALLAFREGLHARAAHKMVNNPQNTP